MRVLITGGTGFVGSHTVAAVVRAGHTVRLLVRTPGRVAAALQPLGAPPVELAIGDITDDASVRAAMRGCDAVIHAASVYSLDSRRDHEIEGTNVRGTEIVLGAAHELGLDPIVYVSSVVALGGVSGQALTPDAPVGVPPGAYMRSKADAERVARSFQDRNAPIVIVYPGAVWGPHDPYLGESARTARDTLRGALGFSIAGGFVLSDVRDVAALHAAVLEAGRGPRRYLAPGTAVSLREFLRLMRRVTGRRLPSVQLPGAAVLPVIQMLDAAQRLLPVRLPLNYQTAWLVSQASDWDDSATGTEFGLVPRDPQESIADTLRWMYAAGQLTRKEVGQLASAVPGAPPSASRVLAVGESAQTFVNAREKWNDTGICLERGAHYFLRARGTWVDAGRVSDADGYAMGTFAQGCFASFRRAPCAQWMALIGALDADPARSFRIGTSRTIVPLQTGVLGCFANDLSLTYWNNIGSIRLEVTRLD